MSLERKLLERAITALDGGELYRLRVQDEIRAYLANPEMKRELEPPLAVPFAAPKKRDQSTDLIFKRLTNMEVDQLLSSALSTHEIICAVENRLALKNDAKYF